MKWIHSDSGKPTAESDETAERLKAQGFRECTDQEVIEAFDEVERAHRENYSAFIASALLEVGGSPPKVKVKL